MKHAIDAKADAPQDNITKTGIIIYRVGTCAIRDDGEDVKISRGSSPEGLEAARLSSSRAVFFQKPNSYEP